MTQLVVSGITIPNGAIRNPTVSVAWLDNGELAYDCNGVLRDMTLQTRRRRQITVTCTDIRAPEMENIWRGDLVTITLIPHLLGAAAPEAIACRVDSYEPSREEFQALTEWTLVLLEIGEEP